jgi:hypothetical protein
VGYVRTPEQIESYESYYREVVYHFSGVSVGFTMTAEFVRQVLPPCLGPPAEPRGMVGCRSAASPGRVFRPSRKRRTLRACGSLPCETASRVCTH